MRVLLWSSLLPLRAGSLVAFALTACTVEPHNGSGDEMTVNGSSVLRLGLKLTSTHDPISTADPDDPDLGRFLGIFPGSPVAWNTVLLHAAAWRRDNPTKRVESWRRYFHFPAGKPSNTVFDMSEPISGLEPFHKFDFREGQSEFTIPECVPHLDTSGLPKLLPTGRPDCDTNYRFWRPWLGVDSGKGGPDDGLAEDWTSEVLYPNCDETNLNDPDCPQYVARLLVGVNARPLFLSPLQAEGGGDALRAIYFHVVVYADEAGEGPDPSGFHGMPAGASPEDDVEVSQQCSPGDCGCCTGQATDGGGVLAFGATTPKILADPAEDVCTPNELAMPVATKCAFQCCGIAPTLYQCNLGVTSPFFVAGGLPASCLE